MTNPIKREVISASPPFDESCTMGRLAGDQCRNAALQVRGSSGAGAVAHIKPRELVTPIILPLVAVLL